MPSDSLLFFRHLSLGALISRIITRGTPLQSRASDMPLSGKEIEVKEGIYSLLLFVPEFIAELTVATEEEAPKGTTCKVAPSVSNSEAV